jgi:drug/metabolite transporter (DMT)-like permease
VRRAAPRGAALVAAGAVVISWAPVFVRLLEDAIGPSAIAAGRGLLGGVVLAALGTLSGVRLRGPRRAVLLACLAGLLLAADFAAWHRSIARVGGGMATILGNTQVVWVALAGTLAMGERGGMRLVASVAAAALGVSLLAGVLERDAAARPDAAGVAFGCATGVLYAAFLLVLRRAGRDPRAFPPVACLAWVSLACGVASLAAAAATGERIVPPDARAWGALAGLALAAQVAGWMLITTGLPRVPVSRAGLLLLLQPTLSTLWGMALLGERLSLAQAAGAAVTLAAIYLGSTATGTERARSRIP